jgi:glycerol uptake facilitator-like aquaporin
VTASLATAVRGRRLLAEFVGTGLLVTVVVGSGIAAQNLSRDAGLQLLENSLVTAAGLGVLILIFGPVSGAHFNPAVSAVDWWLGRRSRAGLQPRDLLGYVLAQVTGGVGGALLADGMFDRPLVAWSQHTRTGVHLWLGEVVATAGLLLVIVALARTGNSHATPWAVGAYIGAAYWFTSSTSFANPAVTIARAFTDTFAGIAPASLPGFVLAQAVGAGVGLLLIVALYPDAADVADELVVPHPADRAHSTAGTAS